MTAPITVIVTGAVRDVLQHLCNRLLLTSSQNRGIGQAICQLILSKREASPLKLIATSRKGEDLGLTTHDGNQQISYSALDILNGNSIKALADKVAGEGKVDVLINNAGVNLDDQYGPDNTQKTLDVNFRGTLEV